MPHKYATDYTLKTQTKYERKSRMKPGKELWVGLPAQ